MSLDFTEEEVAELLACVRFTRSNLETLVGLEYANRFGPDEQRIAGYGQRINRQNKIVNKLRGF